MKQKYFLLVMEPHSTIDPSAWHSYEVADTHRSQIHIDLGCSFTTSTHNTMQTRAL